MGIVYAREIEGVEHTFRVSGKLIMNALVMYDHQTNTLWSQFLIQGVKGPLVNGDLEIAPAVQTSWQQWANLPRTRWSWTRAGVTAATLITATTMAG